VEVGEERDEAQDSVRAVSLQHFGFGLAMAILIDVTVVRALLVRSAMAIFGRWNWWLQAGVVRVLRVQPSPLGPSAGRSAPYPTRR
jgi:putative drug exporter of the RND superfamily